MAIQAHLRDWLSLLMGPSPLAIALALVIALSVPLILHLIIHRSIRSSSLPSFLIIGPTGSGKTSLLTLLERGEAAATHTSQTPLSVEAFLPLSTLAASSKYRSANDPSLHVHKKFLLIDTPGHAKLRYHALETLTHPENLKGLIFLVDAADLSWTESTGSAGGLRQAAEYLHDVLLLLQKASVQSHTSKAPKQMPVLIAANKMDLFTALPVPRVKSALETAITRIRTSRSKGLLDSGIGMGDGDIMEEKDWLGEGGERGFDLAQMDEFNVPVEVAGGNVLGPDGPDVSKWWAWIGNQL